MKLFVAAKGLVEYKGKILILRESSDYITGTQEGKYDFPGGRIDPGESLVDALVREAKEEAGLTIQVGPSFHVSEKFQTIQGDACHIVRTYFHCTTPDTNVVLSRDHDAFAWINPNEHANYNLIGNEHETFERFIAVMNR